MLSNMEPTLPASTHSRNVHISLALACRTTPCTSSDMRATSGEQLLCTLRKPPSQVAVAKGEPGDGWKQLPLHSLKRACQQTSSLAGTRFQEIGTCWSPGCFAGRLKTTLLMDDLPTADLPTRVQMTAAWEAGRAEPAQAHACSYG